MKSRLSVVGGREKGLDPERVPDPFGLDRQFFAKYIDPVLNFFYETWFRVEVTGLENIPDEGSGLIVANHAGSLPWDGPMIAEAIYRHHPAHRSVRYLVLDWLVAMPFMSVLIQKGGFVLACPENAKGLLRRGELVGVFPEGAKGPGKLFRDRYNLARFGRGGFARLALETETTLIPTAVIGSEEVYPVLAHVPWLARMLGLPYFPITPTFPWLGLAGVIPLPAKFYIHFDKPIRLKKGSRERATDFLAVRTLSEHVRQRIQIQVRRLLSRRRDVWRG